MMTRRTILLLTALAAAVAVSSGALAAMSQPARAAFPGVNGKITFVSARDGNEEIYVMDSDGTHQIRLTNSPEDIFQLTDSLPAFSPDGERIAFTTRRDSVAPAVNDEIYVMDAQDHDGDGNGDNLTRITNSLVNEFQPAFSPDGQRIAFTSNQTGNNEVYVMDSDGTHQIRLTNNGARDARPSFSPDGQRIAFTSNRLTPDNPVPPGQKIPDDEIYVMDLQDSDGDGNDDHLTQLTSNTVPDTHANFSPDGREVAFTSRVSAGNDEIYVVSSDGSGVSRHLTDNLATDEFPSFSPDGKQVAFSSDRDGNLEIYVMRSSGDETPIRLTNTPASESKPDWGPLPDTTPPSIALTTPADGATYTLGQVVNATYSCADEPSGSGLASCVGTVPSGDPIDTATVGPKTFMVEAADDAGNTASTTHAYSVLYDFVGFNEPVDNPPTTNAVKAGSAVPVKFSLGGDQGLEIFAEGFPRSGKIPADPRAELDDIEQTVTAGTSVLTYDSATDQYTYVWKTEKAWSGQTRQLVLKLDDGSERLATFEFN